MEFLNNPTVKTIVSLLAVCNAALIAYPGTPPVMKSICGVLAAVFTGVFGVTVRAVNKELVGARAENLALQAQLKGVQP